MSAKNVQFSVAVHVMTVLGCYCEKVVVSETLSKSVNADPSFVRKVVAKLAAAGLITTTRGKNGHCRLAKRAEKITLLDIYRAVEAPRVFSIHAYPVERSCLASRHHKQAMEEVLDETQTGFEKRLAKKTLSELVAIST